MKFTAKFMCGLAGISLLGSTSLTKAGSIDLAGIDGVKGSGWTASDLAGTMYAGTGHEVAVYAMQDANYFYVAYERTGTTDAKQFDGVNHYVDSWDSTYGGHYGDGDDVIVEGGNYHWAYGLNGASTGVWSSSPTDFTAAGGGRYTDSSTGLYEGYSAGGDFSEFAVKKSLINFSSYTSIEVGGQAWNYGFDWLELNTSSIVTASPAAVPLPTSALAGLALFPALAVARRLRRRA